MNDMNVALTHEESGDDKYLASLSDLSNKQLLQDLSEYAGYDPYYKDLREALFAEVAKRLGE